MARPLTFGLCLDQNMDWSTTVARWRLFESLGFDSLWNCDHLEQPSKPGGPYFEAWTQLAALASITEQARIGVLVTSNTFRHPGILARMAVTVDHVSNGRLELGIGAGWYVAEHEAYGIAFDPPGERVDQLIEVVQVLDLLLREESPSFDGKHYQLKDAPSRPGPVQQPRPPLTIGAHRPRMMRLVAEKADRWSTSGTPEEVARKSKLLDEALAVTGRDPDSIIRSVYGWAAKMPFDPWDSVGAFDHCIGTYQEAGITDFIIDQPAPGQLGVLERVVVDALPRWRG